MAKNHNHGPCEKCDLERRKSEVMRSVLRESERRIQGLMGAMAVQMAAQPSMETRAWLGRVRRASRGQMMSNEGCR